MTSHHPQEVLLAQFSLYVHKGGLKPDHFILLPMNIYGYYAGGETCPVFLFAKN